MHSIRMTRAQRRRQRILRAARRARLSSLVVFASLLGCSISLMPSTPFPGAAPTLPAVDGWELLATGLERRVYLPNNANALSQLVVVRVDPAYYHFRAHYQPGAPMSVQRWQEANPNAVALVNANFFDPQGNALGLVVADGAVYGQSLYGQGGTFQVQNGQPRVRSNILEPYAGEVFEQAVQAFPMLVVDGQPNPNNLNDSDISRRTVVAQDTSGRILLMVTPLVGLTLNDLSNFLAGSDMAITNALNLDGGGSTLMYVGAGTSPTWIRSFDAVPTILAVYPN